MKDSANIASRGTARNGCGCLTCRPTRVEIFHPHHLHWPLPSLLILAHASVVPALLVYVTDDIWRRPIGFCKTKRRALKQLTILGVLPIEFGVPSKGSSRKIDQ